jgi:hypothetical protein
MRGAVTATVAEHGFPSVLAEALMRYFEQAATHLVNAPA